jgi:aldose sugar dehydrogenase
MEETGPPARAAARVPPVAVRPGPHRLVRTGLAALALAAASPASGEQLADATDQHRLRTLTGEVRAERVLSGLSQPVAIEFLPDGKALVLQRDLGQVSLADFASRSAVGIEGLPVMHVAEAAGVQDVELHPDHARNGWIYVSYSVGTEQQSTCVVDRFRLDGTRATGVQRIFTAQMPFEGLWHVAARMAFVDGYLYVAFGDREQPGLAQDNSNHAGTIVRLHDDGRVPADNPFVGQTGPDGRPALPEIWSYGHRDPQGLYRHPVSNELWSHEHGPQGGDEVNRVRKGANYGWPLVSFGYSDDGGAVGAGMPTQPGIEDPAWVYVPSIAPSDLVVYQGSAFPQWRGNFLIGAMRGTHLNRLVMTDGDFVAEERIALRVLGRVRAVAVDAAGEVYLGTDGGDVWRLRPVEQ